MVAPVPGAWAQVGGGLRGLFVSFSVFKQEVWIEALSHFYLSQRKWDLMKTISLGLKRSRASCLHGNKTGLLKYILKCSQGLQGRRVMQTENDPYPIASTLCSQGFWREGGRLGGAAVLSPNQGRDSQARDCLHMHTGSMYVKHVIVFRAPLLR